MRTGSGQEITCLLQNSADSRATCVLLGTQDRRVQIWKFERNVLTPLLLIQVDKTVPKAIEFSDNGKDVILFGLFDGKM